MSPRALFVTALLLFVLAAPAALAESSEWQERWLRVFVTTQDEPGPALTGTRSVPDVGWKELTPGATCDLSGSGPLTVEVHRLWNNGGMQWGTVGHAVADETITLDAPLAPTGGPTSPVTMAFQTHVKQFPVGPLKPGAYDVLVKLGSAREERFKLKIWP